MPILRSVPTLWIGFALGLAAAAAYVGLVEPLTSRVVDGALTALSFVVGGAAGISGARLTKSALADRRSRTPSTREPAVV